MFELHLLRLHWKLFFPLVLLLWLIIGITMVYFVRHEEQRLKANLENRLLNVNNTVIEAYEHGADLQNTVDFIKLFTNRTTLDPLRITVYDDKDSLVADNPQTTIYLYDKDGNEISDLKNFNNNFGSATVHDMSLDSHESMVSMRISDDGRIRSYAALPYNAEVLAFLSYDPMVWVVVIALAVLMSVFAYFGVRAICKNVYSLRDFAQAIANDRVPENVENWKFSKDELGDVSRNLVSLYRDKIHAEREKLHHEHQIGMNVSHELNTPVGIIKGYIDTVIDDENMPAPVRRKFLMRAQQNINRLANLVNDVSEVMRLQVNGSGVVCFPLNFHDFLSQLSEDIVQGHIADNMKVNFDVPIDCEVKGHESLLNNAMLNLVYNAAQHSGGDAIILRWIGQENGKHIFTFTDNGTGVGKEHLPRLFDLFYRVDSGRARSKGGSGLGLTLVEKIFIAMGGDITVDNSQKGGLKFTFSLPAANRI